MQRFFLRFWYAVLASILVLFVLAPASAVIGVVVQRVVNRQTVLPDMSGASRDTFVDVDTMPAAEIIAPGTQQQATLAAGLHHTCVVAYSGNVLCWGGNQSGQLGLGIDGSALPAGYVANPVGALASVAQLVSGATHTCARLQEDGSVWCWGANDQLQLGQRAAGPLTDSASAVRVPALSDVSTLAAGRAHTCALRADGSVWCWGASAVGQAGTTTATARLTAVPLPEAATAISAGADTSCATLVSGGVWCWGAAIPGVSTDGAVPTQTVFENVDTMVLAGSLTCVLSFGDVPRCWSSQYPQGQQISAASGVSRIRAVANGTVCAVRTDALVCWGADGAAQIEPVVGIVDVSGGEDFQCVALRAGRVRCRGSNDHGQLAVTSTAASTSFVGVALGNASGLLSAGAAHVCGMWQVGSLRCWGRAYEGQLGTADSAGLRSSAEPVTPNVTGVTAVATGAQHTCVLRQDGSVSCWGSNDHRQIGSGDTLDHGTPLLVPGIVDGIAVTAGRAHTCVLVRDGGVWCWGDNNAGQSGGTSPVVAQPTRLSTLPPLVAIASGAETNCGLQADGYVVCWGREIGGVAAYVPFRALTDATSVAVGGAVVCASRVDGTVWCWGDTRGDGSDTPPLQITGLPPVQALSAGLFHTCAIDTNQQLWCWGGNRSGQVDPSTADAFVSAPIARGTYVAAVSAGATMTCARTVGGATTCWGANTYGQLSAADPDATEATVSGYDDGFALAAGGNFSCALLKYVTVRCWGSNEYGQLGDGTTTAAALPQTVRSNEEAVSIAAGSAHACQIVVDGTVRCWGHNNFGQLGNEATEDSSTPVVAAVQAAVALSLGQSHSCALLQDGGGACWGKNDDGQLGSGNTASSGMPLRVADLTDATALAAGGNHTCALHQDSTVSCWGRNEQGQLGIASVGPGVSVPVRVPGLSDVLAISAGTDHTCARKTDGTVWCWGWNLFGQTGSATVGEKAYTLTPTAVSDLTDAIALQLGGNHSCVVRRNGAVRCWGDNYNGQLGVTRSDGTTYDTRGQTVRGLGSVIQIAAGGAHTCALLQRGAVRCWGWNRDGQLGTGSQTLRTDVDTPMPVVGQQGIRSLAIGEGHICDIDTVGTVWCWGSNDTGQLGIGVMGDIGNFAHPNEVDAAVDSIAMELGADHSCALLETAELNCWGHNQHGQLGNSFAGDIADSVVPNFVIGMQNVTAFGAGGDTSCAVSNGIVSCWGDNQYGQLGTATVGVGDFRVSATPVEGIDAVADIAVGTHHVCALRSDQSVWCWGRNNVHQIDASAAEMVIQPRRIELTTPIVQINAAADHTCALDTAGAVWCWGNNQSGQLSVIGEAIRTVQPVKDIPPMQVLATGQQHSCALSTSGTVWCWGSNEHGQMGVSRSETRTNLPPTEIPQFSGMTALFAGANRTCALDPAGVVWCWGENTAGTMGISPNPDRFTPAVVSKLWSMRMSPLAPRERTPLPVLPTLVPSATAVPTRTTVPTRTLVRLPTRVP